jgi:hypothetical protein
MNKLFLFLFIFLHNFFGLYSQKNEENDNDSIIQKFQHHPIRSSDITFDKLCNYQKFYNCNDKNFFEANEGTTIIIKKLNEIIKNKLIINEMFKKINENTEEFKKDNNSNFFETFGDEYLNWNNQWTCVNNIFNETFLILNDINNTFVWNEEFSKNNINEEILNEINELIKEHTFENLLKVYEGNIKIMKIFNNNLESLNVEITKIVQRKRNKKKIQIISKNDENLQDIIENIKKKFNIIYDEYNLNLKFIKELSSKITFNYSRINQLSEEDKTHYSIKYQQYIQDTHSINLLFLDKKFVSLKNQLASFIDWDFIYENKDIKIFEKEIEEINQSNIEFNKKSLFYKKINQDLENDYLNLYKKLQVEEKILESDYLNLYQLKVEEKIFENDNFKNDELENYNHYSHNLEDIDLEKIHLKEEKYIYQKSKQKITQENTINNLIIPTLAIIGGGSIMAITIKKKIKNTLQKNKYYQNLHDYNQNKKTVLKKELFYNNFNINTYESNIFASAA